MNEKDKLVIEFLTKIKNIRASAGFTIIRKIWTFRTSFSIYAENYRVLTKTLNKYYENTNIHRENSVNRWRIQRTIIKDIHNLISSAKSYIEHISKMNSSQSFQQKISKEFEKNPLYHFIRSLRNFLMHEEPLPLISEIEFSRLETGQVETSQFESMDKKSFKNFLKRRTNNGQNSQDAMAMNYLEHLPDKFNLNTILQEHNKLLCSFHEWSILTYVKENNTILNSLSTEIEKIHQDAFKNNLTQDHPMTKGQLRHLNFLLFKSQ